MNNDAATDLFAAIHANNLEGVRLLLGAEPALLASRSPSGLSPVLFAAYYHRPDILRLLVEAGASLDIFEAAAAGQLAPLRDLLNADPARLSAVSSDGFSLLGLAAFFGHEQVAAELLARGADVNAASHNAMQVRPLHSAAAANHMALARLLLDAGAEVNAAQHGGYTPLHSAAQNGNTELVALLLSRGADPAARTEEGHTPADLAREEGHMALLEGQSQETGKANAAAIGQNRRMDNQEEIIGVTDVTAGTLTPDPKESDPSTIFTSTPATDRVGAADGSTYTPVEVDPGAVTTQFDALATRDVGAMEHQLQAPEYEGSQSVETLGVSTAALDGAVASAGVGVPLSVGAIDQHVVSAADQNPGYTPPSKMAPPHLPERPGMPSDGHLSTDSPDLLDER